ncbi:uncharacterized protein bub1ba isoform X10 [Dicentrarchus labrax]|uniref:uncharacterized protein bub1ba isoform X10 n=1 Tax=Dicentrarchus labrax TaxID=13489 RepID=UPI0021F660AC|nr:uncharacterized protein bub1ba isoform X10 [Dicentrarchus labrax]
MKEVTFQSSSSKRPIRATAERQRAAVWKCVRGAVMAEGLLMKVEASLHSQSAYQSEPLSRGAGLQRSAYCKEQLRRGAEEFCFEELRAERLNRHRQQELDEKLRRVTELKEQLGRELEEQLGRELEEQLGRELEEQLGRELEEQLGRELEEQLGRELEEQLGRELEEQKHLLRLTQQVPEGSSSQISDSDQTASSFQIYNETQTAAARPAGNELTDDVFLRPDERGPCLRIQYPRQDHQGGTTQDLQAQEESRPPVVSQKPVTKTRQKLSTIQETSVDGNSRLSLRDCSPLWEDQAPSSDGGAVDPCDPDVRRRLLCDVTSSPDFHSEPHPLPPVEEHSCLQLGGDVYLLYDRAVDGGGFCVYKGALEDDYVLLKVDSCSVPWDFHQFQRLKNSSLTASLPHVSCFQFLDGCITVYTTPTDHMFTELTECVPCEASVGRRAIGLLQLVSQLHSCRLLHAALQPNILTCSHRGLLSPHWVFPVDWSSSVDLDLQQDVTSVQQVLSAQNYISLGLLDPNAPPQLVDLVGVAETVHHLLTNRRMVAVKDENGWTPEQFSGDEPWCGLYTTAVFCTFTCCNLHIYLLYSAHLPAVICTFTCCNLHIYLLYSAHLPAVFCTFTCCILHIYLLYSAHLPAVICTFTAFISHILLALSPCQF